MGWWRRSGITTTAHAVSGGLFPLDEQLRVWDKGWSEGLAKLVVWLSGQVDYSLAEEVLQQVGGLRLSDTSIWRRAKRWGEKIKALEALRIAGALGMPQQDEVVRGESKTAQRMGVAMDGMMVNVREEGWKELKVGCVFELEVGRGAQRKQNSRWSEFVRRRTATQ